MELVILAGLGVWLVLALRASFRSKGGCGGCCEHCSGCAHQKK